MTTTPQRVGIVGATGAVGKEVIGVLEKRGYPVSALRLFGSERSAGTKVATTFGEVTIEAYSLAAARETDVLFLCVDGDFALANGEKLSAPGGPLVIDNSSAFRRDPKIPLVVPEINAGSAKGARLVANPNCTTAILLMCLAPLVKLLGLKRAIVSTYQAASGAGAEGMAELQEGLAAGVAGKPIPNKVFAHPLPYNVIPHIDVFQPNGYTKEEMKVTWETRKILEMPDLLVSCTAVRIPTLRAHSESVTIETERPVDLEQVREVLRNAPGVRLVDDPALKQYPMPLTATGSYDVEVGRLRKNDVFGEFGLDMFIVGDQLLRGAALNAVLIAEELVA
ncbi:aspartate-semialdehyde dehydrogenase [Pavlovales sp. CCMP2436]|nr:aspartate-semialdehyde dehydrogenase [Pavlovales sp. CCMP2436]